MFLSFHHLHRRQYHYKTRKHSLQEYNPDNRRQPGSESGTGRRVSVQPEDTTLEEADLDDLNSHRSDDPRGLRRAKTGGAGKGPKKKANNICRILSPLTRNKLSITVHMKFSFSWMNSAVLVKTENGRKRLVGSSTKKMLRKELTDGENLMWRHSLSTLWLTWDVAWKLVWCWWTLTRRICRVLPIALLNRWVKLLKGAFKELLWDIF